MHDWYEHFHDSLWLKDDAIGAEEADFLWQALKLQPGARVLDVPCGAGRIAVHLARKGAVMTGVDRNTGFINRAQARFAAEGLSGTFVEMDMRRLDFRGEFDAIYNWGGSFGYFSEVENAEVLRHMAKALKPGGRLLIDQPNRERMLRHFRDEVILPDGWNENRWIPATQQVETRWHRPSLAAMYALTIRLYTAAQFRRLFARAGVTVEAIYAGIDGSPYSRGGRRTIVVGYKEEGV